MTQTKFIGLMFQTPLMEAHIAGRKNQTRRGRGLDKINENPDEWEIFHQLHNGTWIGWAKSPNPAPSQEMTNKLYPNGNGFKCPYGQVGDILYFKEKHLWQESPYRGYKYAVEYSQGIQDTQKWQSSMLMPARACRMWGKITGVEVHRLHDISQEDAINEGIERNNDFETLEVYKHYTLNDLWVEPTTSYLSLFKSINGKELTSRNPWLWVIRYEVTTEAPQGWTEYINQLKK